MSDPARLAALEDQIAEVAAAEARQLVRQAANLVNNARTPLEAVERAAQEASAAIGRAAVAAVVKPGRGTHPSHTGLPGRASGPAGPTTDPDHPDPARQVRTGPRLLPLRHLPGRVRALGRPSPDRGHQPVTRPRPGAVLAGAEMPYAKGFEFIGTVTGLDLASPSTLARTTRTQGARARTLIDAEHRQALTTTPRPVPAAWVNRPDLCYLVIDGTGVPMLPCEIRGRMGKDGGRAGTREVKIGCLFTQTGLDPATGEPVQDPDSVSYISSINSAGRVSPTGVRTELGLASKKGRSAHRGAASTGGRVERRFCGGAGTACRHGD